MMEEEIENYVVIKAYCIFIVIDIESGADENVCLLIMTTSLHSQTFQVLGYDTNCFINVSLRAAFLGVADYHGCF